MSNIHNFLDERPYASHFNSAHHFQRNGGLLNLTERLKDIDPVPFARGGFAVVHKAKLYSEELSKDLIVAIKFPDVSSIVAGGGADSASLKTKILQDVYKTTGGGGTECTVLRQKISRYWKREITAGQSVSHPNVLAFLGFCDNPNTEYKEFVGIVLPHCKNGNIRSYLQRHSRVDRRRMLVSIAAALFALHSRSSPVVHGDIKASNILIDERGDPLLADFGLSRVCHTRGFTTKSTMGSIRWMSPELLRTWTDIPQDGASVDDQIVRTTRASDVWAFGMTIFEILTGNVPFVEYNHDAGVIVGIVSKNARPRRPSHILINDAVWSLLEHCWAEKPSIRPDARHVGLVLDIIYSHAQGTIDAHTMSAILVGALDNADRQEWQTQSGSASRPYVCKWLHCLRAFDCIDDCVAHECAEFESRRSAAGL